MMQVLQKISVVVLQKIKQNYCITQQLYFWVYTQKKCKHRCRTDCLYTVLRVTLSTIAKR